MVTEYWNCWFSASKAKKQSHECHREHSWSFDNSPADRGTKKHVYLLYQGTISFRFYLVPLRLVRARLHETGTKSNRGDFVLVISFYSKCLHESRTKIAHTGLKSSRPLDQANYVQTGMKSKQDECKHKYISERSQFCKRACARATTKTKWQARQR